MATVGFWKEFSVSGHLVCKPAVGREREPGGRVTVSDGHSNADISTVICSPPIGSLTSLSIPIKGIEKEKWTLNPCSYMNLTDKTTGKESCCQSSGSWVSREAS